MCHKVKTIKKEWEFMCVFKALSSSSSHQEIFIPQNIRANALLDVENNKDYTYLCHAL